MEQLKRRGIALAIIHSLCGEAEEDLEHLLIHCPMVLGLWVALMISLGVYWLLLYLVEDLILDWKGFLFRERNEKFWMAAPLSLLDNLEGKE